MLSVGMCIDGGQQFTDKHTLHPTDMATVRVVRLRTTPTRARGSMLNALVRSMQRDCALAWCAQTWEGVLFTTERTIRFAASRPSTPNSVEPMSTKLGQMNLKLSVYSKSRMWPIPLTLGAFLWEDRTKGGRGA